MSLWEGFLLRWFSFKLSEGCYPHYTPEETEARSSDLWEVTSWWVVERGPGWSQAKPGP